MVVFAYSLVPAILLAAAVIMLIKALPIALALGAAALLLVAIIAVFRFLGVVAGVLVCIAGLAWLLIWIWPEVERTAAGTARLAIENRGNPENTGSRDALLALVMEDLQRIPSDWSRPVGAENPPLLGYSSEDGVEPDFLAALNRLCGDFGVDQNVPQVWKDHGWSCPTFQPTAWHRMADFKVHGAVFLAQLARDQFEQGLCNKGISQHCDATRPQVLR